MARDDGRRATPPALTADGVKRLFDGSVVTGGVVVQVLGIYRCKAGVLRGVTLDDSHKLNRLDVLILAMQTWWIRR